MLEMLDQQISPADRYSLICFYVFKLSFILWLCKFSTIFRALRDFDADGPSERESKPLDVVELEMHLKTYLMKNIEEALHGMQTYYLWMFLI